MKSHVTTQEIDIEEGQWANLSEYATNKNALRITWSATRLLPALKKMKAK